MVNQLLLLLLFQISLHFIDLIHSLFRSPLALSSFLCRLWYRHSRRTQCSFYSLVRSSFLLHSFRSPSFCLLKLIHIQHNAPKSYNIHVWFHFILL
uniref:Putative secreted protein n=1 Tax=Anopheles marajoara TaxID=58244 RepID=A0A2M4C9G0_9DIPT